LVSQKGSSPAKQDGLTFPLETGPAEGEVMLLLSKIVWAGTALTLLTTGMLVQGFPQSPAVSDSNTEAVTVFVVKNEIKKVQETLCGKGYYEGKVDGVFGLRTRASIRAFQKAESLPITGQVDTRTAAGLGVRPESSWDNSQSSERQVRYSSDIVLGEPKRAKPSAGIRPAGIRRTEDRAKKTSRRETSGATAIKDNRRGGADKQQAENEEHHQ
jgi:peptidoglycan hydrolase-like protein with peptidoglycan-binding domain